MAVSPPIYGNIQVDEQLDINTLIDRMESVSTHFLNQSEFSAYMVLKSSQRFYGLNKSELVSLFHEYEGTIQSLAFSLSAPNGGGVRINLQWIKGKDNLQGQFIIATGRKWINEEIWEILHGTWTPRDRPDNAMMNMLESLRQAKLVEQMQKKAENNHIAQEKVYKKEDLVYREEAFSLDPQVSFQRIIGLLDELSIVFLDESTFHFRLGTTDGDYFVDISQSRLNQIFRFERARIHTLYMDANTEDGQRVDIVLRFHKVGNNPDTLVEVTAYEAEEIVEHVREVLGAGAMKTLRETAIFHKKFIFDPETLSIDTLIILINAILATYLKEVNPVTGLYTFSGKSFAQLSLNQLKEAYYRNENQVKKLTISASSANGALFFFLSFKWDSEDTHRGEMQMNLGDDERHQTVYELLWERLKLERPFKAPTQGIDGNRDMVIMPVFEHRQFSDRELGCLMVMPLEAYWSDPIWNCVRRTLDGLNYEYLLRASALNEEGSLENTWQAINEVDWIIVDLTYRQPDVFYILGIAHTLGKNVLLITQHERDIPAELKKFDYFVYDNNLAGLETLQIELTKRLRSTKHT